MLSCACSGPQNLILRSRNPVRGKKNYFFLENYITSEGAVTHNVLYFHQLSAVCFMLTIVFAEFLIVSTLTILLKTSRYTVRNVETTTATFRANTHPKVLLMHGCVSTIGLYAAVTFLRSSRHSIQWIIELKLLYTVMNEHHRPAWTKMSRCELC